MQVLDQNGEKLASYYLAGTAERFFLDGRSLVVAGRAGMRVIDPLTGRLQRRWSTTAKLEDVEGGWAVLLDRMHVRFLRIADGVTHSVAILGFGAPEHAQLQPVGLFVTQAAPEDTGRAAFVARRKLPPAVRSVQK